MHTLNFSFWKILLFKSKNMQTKNNTFTDYHLHDSSHTYSLSLYILLIFQVSSLICKT